MKVKQESWADGRPDGTWTVWKNGRVEWTQTYVSGVPTIATSAAVDKQAPTAKKSGDELAQKHLLSANERSPNLPDVLEALMQVEVGRANTDAECRQQK